MENPFAELKQKIESWESLKDGKFKMGKFEGRSNTAYGEVDVKNSDRYYWIHRYFDPLNDEEIQAIEKQHNTQFPLELRQFYSTFSCAELFADRLVIRGFWSKRFGESNSLFQHIQSAGQSIGYYQTETGMFIGITRHYYNQLGWIHLDFTTGITDLYLRPTGGEFTLEKSYPTLVDFVYSMYDHLEPWFDRNTGLLIGKRPDEP
jgi:hypothetical protein